MRLRPAARLRLEFRAQRPDAALRPVRRISSTLPAAIRRTGDRRHGADEVIDCHCTPHQLPVVTFADRVVCSHCSGCRSCGCYCTPFELESALFRLRLESLGRLLVEPFERLMEKFAR